MNLEVINYQKNLLSAVMNQAVHKFYENSSVHFVLIKHETNFPLIGYG